ncbi:glycosyltransferase family 2 protein [Latilactobacillus sakei]|uniref:glycosyltransferase family 2 protein n=1 Tax=Latilactobacillus sakei TaxID=1599 RepID=UPI0015F35D87|nr:glycosyltransferase family A protein [Latilactobacillus sakei]QMU87140.1 glycosyltransferase family 2 protein [Latilactobacillus sakei]
MDFKNKPKVSIIIPVYNGESYIQDTLQNVIKQTYKEIEIIIVDDGSKDQSYNKLLAISKNDSRIKLFHKSNGGMSSARNYGLKQVTSEYVTFIDSDDYISIDYIATLINPFLVGDSVEISVVGYQRIFDYNPNKFTNVKDISLLNSTEGLNECLLQKKGYDVSVCSKLYKTSLFLNCNFIEGIAYEDFEMTPRLFAAVSDNGEVAVIDAIKYLYMKTPNSIMTSSFQKRDMDILYVVRSGGKFVVEYLPGAESAYRAKAIAGVFGVYRKALWTKADKEDSKELFNELRSMTRQIRWHNGFSKKELLVSIIVLLGEKLSTPIVMLITKLLQQL